MDAGPLIAGLLCGLVVGLPIGFWIVAAILRTAISLTNKVLGGGSPNDLDFYNIPGDCLSERYPRSRVRSGLAVPMPSVGRAMLVSLAIWVVDSVVQFGLTFAASGGHVRTNSQTAAVASFLISLPVCFVVDSAMLSSLLPTSLGRAALVVVFDWLVSLLIAAVIAVVAVAGGLAVR